MRRSLFRCIMFLLYPLAFMTNQVLILSMTRQKNGRYVYSLRRYRRIK